MYVSYQKNIAHIKIATVNLMCINMHYDVKKRKVIISDNPF